MGRLTAACLAASLAPSAAKQKLPAFAFDKSTNWGQPDGQGLKTDGEHDKTDQLAGHCEIDVGDGSRWVFQRVGVWESDGGYDWWQFGWADPFGLDALRAAHGPVYVLNHFTGGVDADSGEVLGFPPIHVHHVHLSPAKTTPMRRKWADCIREEYLGHRDADRCGHQFTVLMEQHGDYACRESEGGSNCYLEQLPDGYAKVADGPYALNGELNDVRPKGSPILRWYYQAAIRYVPVEDAARLGFDLRPLSFYYIWSPGRLYLNDQSTMVNTFQTPTTHDTFVWYTGRTLSASTMLEMDGPEFLPKAGDTTYDCMRPEEHGFADNDAVKRHVFDAYEAYDGPEPAPRLICRGSTDYEEVAFDGVDYPFDRRAPTWCEPWEIKKGDPYVYEDEGWQFGNADGTSLTLFNVLTMAGAREREAEARARGLETPLDDSNKGFRMLRAMGYRAGALGGRGGIEAPVVPAAPLHGGAAARASAPTRRDRARRAVADARLQAAAALERRAAAFHGGVADRTLRRATEARRRWRRATSTSALASPSPIWPAEVADVPSRAFADASGAAYAAALGDAPEPPGGLDGEPPEVQRRAAAAYLRSAHGYCLATGGAASDMDLEAELARLVDDATD
ncbi:hypothetical protein JL722_5977 [Aureococcus anophagefferens]|nr:hypothetical protein JL722_5977 [Aureococcus anophagefferens]